MIEGIIFDLDGTLIDSEPLWQDAEIKIFAEEGLQLTREECSQTMGLLPYDAVKHWHRKIINPTKSVEDIVIEMRDSAFNLIMERGSLKEGIAEVLEFLNNKGVPMAIASASSMKLIEAVAQKFDISKYFRLFYSSDSENYGKPHPAVFISTAQHLKVDPVFTVVFEDSFNGMIAAKAARMKLVAFLDEGRFNDTKYNFADLKLESFYNFGSAEYKFLESLM